MTSGRKLLIDTNVVIGLEDWKELPSSFASLLRLCSKFGHRLFVHEAELADINRDRDASRRRVTLSKIQKFERLSGVKTPSDSDLQSVYGRISSANDQVDAALLYALQLGAVDFLVTEDQGIHARARRVSAELADRVLTVNDAVSWLALQHEPREVRLPLVGELPAHAIDPNDSIFEGLRDDYLGFDEWWRIKCIGEHRLCWIVTIGGLLAGIIVRKDESTDTERVLKLCTFKVKPEFRGEKLGELLLKQAIWFAQRNNYQRIYLTTYPGQSALINFLTYYGFEHSGNSGGELVMTKRLSAEPLAPTGQTSTRSVHQNYPRFSISPPTSVFCVPIRGEYHEMLFPELVDRDQLSLFELMGTPGGPRTPGNTIRKVYLCRANSKSVDTGSVLLFYRSGAGTPSKLSQHITTVGVVEQVSSPPDLDSLIRVTAKRSVYSAEQQAILLDEGERPLRVIDFLLIGHLETPMPLDDLLRLGVFSGHPPQSLAKVPLDRALPVLARTDFGFRIA